MLIFSPIRRTFKPRKRKKGESIYKYGLWFGTNALNKKEKKIFRKKYSKKSY
jgi:hypothetical protein